MPSRAKAQQAVNIYLVTLAVGQTDSGEINLNGESVVGMQPDANLTGVTTKFKVSDAPGGTFVVVQDSAGADLSMSLLASKYATLTDDLCRRLRGLQNFKLTANTAQLTTPSVIKIYTRYIP